jgi:hypothetical protein
VADHESRLRHGGELLQGMSGEPVTRTPAWVEREYGREKWPAIARMVEEECAHETDLARVVGRVARREMYPHGALAAGPAIVDGTPVSVPRALAKGAHQGLVVDAVADACSDATGLIVELGSGWGRNILNVWLSGGPRAATYVAAEYTDAGQGVAARLAALEPRLDFRSVAWDYHNPDLSQLDRVGEAVVFSAHSIEQIPQLTGAAIDAIAGLAERVTCLHFEPVGWQLGDHGRSGSSAEYAAQHDYNRNLIELLAERESQGRLRVELTLPEVIGINPANSSSVIVWRAESQSR